MEAIWVMEWEESERSFGVRPDGWSLHASPEDCSAYVKAYVKAYWARMPDRGPGGEAPDEYERPVWPAPRRCKASPALADWVASGDRRLPRRVGKLDRSRFEISDPELLGRVDEEHAVKQRVRAERSQIDQAAGSAAGSGKKPAL